MLACACTKPIGPLVGLPRDNRLGLRVGRHVEQHTTGKAG